MQNHHFGSKIKITNNMPKSILQTIYSCSVQKKLLQMPPNILKMTAFWKSAIMQRLQPMQNPHFGSKNKIPKNMLNTTLEIIQSCFVPKSAPNQTKSSRNESILKISRHAKARAHAKSSLSVKNWNSKQHVKIHFTNHLQLFCAKHRSKKHQIFEK